MLIRADQSGRYVCHSQRVKETHSYLFFQRFTLKLSDGVTVTSGNAYVRIYFIMDVFRSTHRELCCRMNILLISRKIPVSNTVILTDVVSQVDGKFKSQLGHVKLEFDKSNTRGDL